MGGEAKYTDFQIEWLLLCIVKNVDRETVRTVYEATFDEDLKPASIKYVKTKYGRDPKFGNMTVNYKGGLADELPMPDLTIPLKESKKGKELARKAAAGAEVPAQTSEGTAADTDLGPLAELAAATSQQSHQSLNDLVAGNDVDMNGVVQETAPFHGGYHAISLARESRSQELASTTGTLTQSPQTMGDLATAGEVDTEEGSLFVADEFQDHAINGNGEQGEGLVGQFPQNPWMSQESSGMMHPTFEQMQAHSTVALQNSAPEWMNPMQQVFANPGYNANTMVAPMPYHDQQGAVNGYQNPFASPQSQAPDIDQFIATLNWDQFDPMHTFTYPSPMSNTTISAPLVPAPLDSANQSYKMDMGYVNMDSDYNNMYQLSIASAARNGDRTSHVGSQQNPIPVNDFPMASMNTRDNSRAATGIRQNNARGNARAPPASVNPVNIFDFDAYERNVSFLPSSR